MSKLRRDASKCDYCHRFAQEINARATVVREFKLHTWTPLDALGGYYRESFVGPITVVSAPPGGCLVLGREQGDPLRYGEYFKSLGDPSSSQHDMAIAQFRNQLVAPDGKFKATLLVPPGVNVVRGIAAPQLVSRREWLSGGGTQFFIPACVVQLLVHASQRFQASALAPKDYARFVSECRPAIEAAATWWKQFVASEAAKKEEARQHNLVRALREAYDAAFAPIDPDKAVLDKFARYGQLCKVLADAKAARLTGDDAEVVRRLVHDTRNHLIVLEEELDDVTPAGWTVEAWAANIADLPVERCSDYKAIDDGMKAVLLRSKGSGRASSEVLVDESLLGREFRLHTAKNWTIDVRVTFLHSKTSGNVTTHYYLVTTTHTCL